MSILSGASLPVADFLFELESSCLGIFSLMSLLSGGSLSVGLLNVS